MYVASTGPEVAESTLLWDTGSVATACTCRLRVAGSPVGAVITRENSAMPRWFVLSLTSVLVVYTIS